MDQSLIGFAVGIVFAAGIAYGAHLRAMRDLKGLSIKINQNAEREDKRHRRVIVALIRSVDGERKDDVAELLRGD